MELPELHLEKVAGNPMCFGCGQDNVHSLKLKFNHDGNIARAEFTPTESHQSWPGYVHGGVLMAIMDEAIGWASFGKNIYSVTAKMEVRIRSMARIGEPLVVSAQIEKQSKRTLEMSARISRKDDTIVAEATSVQFVVQ